MFISNVSLTNFRNYKSQTVNFTNALNIIFGDNASGKTNLLESIYLGGLGKSARASKDKELILWGEAFSYLKICVVKKYKTSTIEIHLDNKGKKRIAIDGIPVSKIGDLIGFLNIVYFSPDEMKLIKESPVERRRFMDISLSQQKKVYYYSLVKYNKILAQRNKFIKNTKDFSALKNSLPIWDGQLAKEGAKIIKTRYDFITNLTPLAKEKHFLLSKGKETLSLAYESLCPNQSEEQIEIDFYNKLTNSYEKDFSLGYTSTGPHRDDFNILVNDIEVKKYGSQGQQRTSALSLKLAELEKFEEETGEKPILLLDDVLSELDETRQMELITLTQNIQTLLTCTDFSSSDNTINFIEVKEGTIKNT